MLVPSNHAYVSGGDDICNLLLVAVERAQDTVAEVTTAEAIKLHGRLQSQAQNHPAWKDLAPDISMWPDEDNDWNYGVPEGHPSAERAARTEYGDEHNPPAPLIRMGLVNGVTDMGWSMQEAFMERGMG